MYYAIAMYSFYNKPEKKVNGLALLLKRSVCIKCHVATRLPALCERFISRLEVCSVNNNSCFYIAMRVLANAIYRLV